MSEAAYVCWAAGAWRIRAAAEQAYYHHPSSGYSVRPQTNLSYAVLRQAFQFRQTGSMIMWVQFSLRFIDFLWFGTSPSGFKRKINNALLKHWTDGG